MEFFISKGIKTSFAPFSIKKPPGQLPEVSMGWKTGFEPATSGTTIQRSNQLSYNHHLTV